VEFEIHMRNEGLLSLWEEDDDEDEESVGFHRLMFKI